MDKLLPTIAIVCLTIMVIVSTVVLYPKIVKADTLICQTIMETPPRVLIFSMVNKEIKDINASVTGHSTVKYNDDRKLYINPTTFACHEIMGNNDEKEQELTDQMVDMITGGNLE